MDLLEPHADQFADLLLGQPKQQAATAQSLSEVKIDVHD